MKRLGWLLLAVVLLGGAVWGRRENAVLLFYVPNAATYTDKTQCLRMPYGTTIQRIDCYTGSSTQGVNFVSKTDPSQAGSDVCSGDMTATTVAVACAVMSDDIVAAGEYLCMDVEGAAAAVVLGCSVSVSY